jgi:transcriptional regulator with XRE-family HTH domain
MVSRHAGGRPKSLKRCAMGERIEQLAARRGLHLDEVAGRSGIASATLYRILTGTIRSPRLATVQAIAKTLAVKIEKLAS